jgi:hypothetical protein
MVVIIALLMLAMFKGSAQKVNAPELCTTEVTLNKNYSKASALQSIMDSAAIKGVFLGYHWQCIQKQKVGGQAPPGIQNWKQKPR